ncbi:MAG: S8 family peptidase, partial [Caldilineaceae bacterium]|nr:S8 family peptidase [Caldilineaceae bacterium]
SGRAGQAVAAVDGTVARDLWLIDAVSARLPAANLPALAAMPGIASVVPNYRLAGATLPDVQPTGDPMVYEFLSPPGLDVGADLVHAVATGRGIGIAVIDSGVYFSKDVRDLLGNQIKQQFLGQAVFVGDGACGSEGGKQEANYCSQDWKDARDPYGHGSHVAGAIWSQFQDVQGAARVGIAPDASILSVRVLSANGGGTYEDVIEGIQYVVANRTAFKDPIRVINLSVSAPVTAPYFVDPLNRAVEAAWANGIVVVAAAGNEGGRAESITVPGNDPYVITVGAVDSNRTPGDWSDDVVPAWSSTGPTQDGFIKPDLLAPGANVVSFMYNDPDDMANSAYLVQQHPDYAATANLFRMSGTSMSTAIVSGVAALMLQVNPALTPDQVKFRLKYSAVPAITASDTLQYGLFQQGAGRIWAPAAVLATDIPADSANAGMNIHDDLAHPWQNGDSSDPAQNGDLAYHYQGPVQRLLSDDGQTYLYTFNDPNSGELVALGATQQSDFSWLDFESMATLAPTFENGQLPWGSSYAWG